nr:MAG TPA: hypothetical protein [Herelleviridae sp.]
MVNPFLVTGRILSNLQRQWKISPLIVRFFAYRIPSRLERRSL